MPVIAATADLARSRLGRRGIAAAIGVGAAAALSVATLSSPRVARVLGEGLSDSVQGMKTVAAMLAERSPGERPEGALANLKPKRQATLHERALPKVRGPSPTAYEALAGPPPSPPIVVPPEAPLFNTVAGAPVPARGRRFMFRDASTKCRERGRKASGRHRGEAEAEPGSARRSRRRPAA